MNPLGPGSKLGRFEISGSLGEGAMGLVFLAHDPSIERPVALKTLRAAVAGGEYGQEIESRFLKEAKLAGRLQHPNIVTIYEVGQDQGVYFIAMEYVDGKSLTRFVASHPDFSLADRAEVVRQVAFALQHAHERGVLHRDIKPGNILLTRARGVKVADFGIGKLLTGSADLTRTGQMIGSPAYMSPEQIRGEKLDGRSDFFSLGVVFYELLTGSRPFPGDSITTLVYQILHTEPRDPLSLRADLPPSTREVFARLLAKAPEKRPANAGEFVREIKRIEAELAGSERTRPLPPSAPLPTKVAELPPEPVDTRAVADRELAAPKASPAAPRSFSPAYLFGAAALLVAIAALVFIWRQTAKTEQTTVLPPPAPVPTAAVAVATSVAQAPVPAATPEAIPSPGPLAAADAIVGAPRYSISPAPVRAARTAASQLRQAPSALPVPTSAPVAVASGSTASAVSASLPAPDNVYRTRRYAKFSVSPDQARIYLDGHYVGIADDWDDRGGGKTLEIGRAGPHQVRLDLPGYRSLNLEVIATPQASDQTVEIGDELKRESKVSYPKIPKLDDKTIGPVEFAVDPPDAAISEGGKDLGPASSFGAASPLRLSGPMVHDLLVSASGRKSKTVRILVAENADRDRAKVKVELKKE